MKILDYLKDNILILDGGMGSFLQEKGLQPGERPEPWNLSHPEVITGIHKSYYDAGSNAVITNTFGACGLRFSKEELEEIAAAAVANARRAAEESDAPQPKWVGLDVGPCGKLLKPFGYGSARVDIKGDTCVIYFDGFKEDLSRSASFYTKVPTKQDMQTSTFGLFYYAFEKIKENGKVKNVVIDLSDNGGGSAAALVASLGFLSPDGEVKITYQDLLSKNYCTEWYHVDTNLDGLFDDNDGYGGEYSFYVMTTGSAYSCGNAFPYFSQKEGWAKIIGEQPGGGDCVVAYYVDAYGRVGAISGFKKLGTMVGDTFVSDEKAVVVDYPFTEEEGDEIYFHPKKIAEYVDGITR